MSTTRFLTLSLAISLIVCSASPASARAPLALNLSGVVDWSSEIVFVDVFKASRAWISQAEGKPWGRGGPLDVDDRGNVRRLAPGQYAETVVFTDFGDRFPTGTYTCLYDGTGEIGLTGDARITKREPGRLSVEIKPKDGSVFLRITRTDPDDPVRNIRLIMPGHEDTYEKQPFNPEFLARWKGFQALRFMDWGSTNNSEIVTWSDRPTPADHSQALKGVAAEYMIELCNQLHVDPWFCMPHRADDDYVRGLARLVRERLDSDRKIYIEYSNECWNGGFGQAGYCRDEGKRLGLSNNDYEAQLRYYSRRSTEIFGIWEKEFGGHDRLVRVLATQSANSWTGTTVLDYQDAAKHADAIAIAPYFGYRWGNPDRAAEVAKMTPDELIKALAEDVSQSRRSMEEYAALAKKHGLKLMAYEGGQHLAGHGGAENNDALTALFHAANRHPGMKDLYTRHLADWNEAGGDLFCVFSSMGRYSKWGSWGLLENSAQDPLEVPKYQAIHEYLSASATQR